MTLVPTNRLRFVERMSQNMQRIRGGIGGGELRARSVLQQWWQEDPTHNHGSIVGEWRDVPVELE